MKREQLEILIFDTETFVYFQQKKIDKLIKEKDILSKGKWFNIRRPENGLFA